MKGTQAEYTRLCTEYAAKHDRLLSAVIESSLDPGLEEMARCANISGWTGTLLQHFVSMCASFEPIDPDASDLAERCKACCLEMVAVSQKYFNNVGDAKIVETPIN